MSLNPLSIAHLGIARRPIVAALLGIWDELMAVLAAARLEYHGGGRYRGRKEPDPEEQLHRDHWDYMDSLREIQDKAAKEVVHVSADRVVSSRAMRGKVKALEQHQAAPTAAEGIIGNPILITALMALIDDE